MTHVSLFSGIGGMDIVAEMAGFKATAVCEIDPGCRKVLARHFPNAKQFGDIRDITDGSIETPTLVSAAFPCQPFSVAGSRQGTSDERHLWPEVVRVLGFLRPKWFLGENVRGLLSISEGRVFGSILADLAHLGYSVGWGCYGADEACGAPHRRDRVFIVGYLANPISGGCRGRDNGDAPELRGEVQAEGPRGELADARCRSDQRRGIAGVVPCQEDGAQEAEEEWERCGDSADYCERSMADAESLGRTPGVGFASGITEGFTGPKGSGLNFPTGPADLDAWSRVLRERPDLAPALTAEEEIELSVRPVVDGVSRKMALKMLGNAVVPAQVYPVLKEIARHEQGC